MLLTVTWISSGVAAAAAAALTTLGSRIAEPWMPEMHVFVHTRAQLFLPVCLPHSGFNKSVRVGFFLLLWWEEGCVFITWRSFVALHFSHGHKNDSITSKVHGLILLFVFLPGSGGPLLSIISDECVHLHRRSGRLIF